MFLLETFIKELQHELVGASNQENHNIIRKHTKRLEELGDISFPMNIQNWNNLLETVSENLRTIFDKNLSNKDVDSQCAELKHRSKDWVMQIEKIAVRDCEIHLHFCRSAHLFRNVIQNVFEKNPKYGSSDIFSSEIQVILSHITDDKNTDLTQLRLVILGRVAKNMIQFNSSKCDLDKVTEIFFSTNRPKNMEKFVLCSPVLNDNGIKSVAIATDLYNKRSSDMRMMAQHKYGVQVKGDSAWDLYFQRLGKACVTVEILSNKPQKPIKIGLNNHDTSNKGAPFIFYNCARLSALLKEFKRQVNLNQYPDLPTIEKVDFSLLNQPEEWELFYVYIVQFPIVLKNCIRDIENGIFNPQYLISFLANLTSLFSIYYRRIRILTSPRDHLHAVLHARIYLLKALQIVFHITLGLLDIEPIEEM